jgi:hypothetical protein
MVWSGPLAIPPKIIFDCGAAVRSAPLTALKTTAKREDQIVGFFAATTSGGQAKGVLARALVAGENLAYLPAMLTVCSVTANQQANFCKKAMVLTS